MSEDKSPERERQVQREEKKVEFERETCREREDKSPEGERQLAREDKKVERSSQEREQETSL